MVPESPSRVRSDTPATPSGQVTYLFTDIEGSTRLWRAHPEEMARALAAHFELLDDVVQRHGGRVHQDTGDGIFAVFPVARQGVAASVAAQLALRQRDWGPIGPLRVRMGLHTGEVDRTLSDYRGTPVNRTARIMGVAHGGQVVVSAAAHGLVRDDPPDRVTFRDLGTHRLKDLSDAEHLYQVRHPDLPGDFPPLRSLEEVPNNLPITLSTFVGREGELRQVADALDRSRLVTLTGPGGAGKSRLALQVAADRIDVYPDGVWLVELAPLNDGDQLPRAVASGLSLPELVDAELVIDHLRTRHTLLVMDNCEHVIDAATSFLDEVLRISPHVSALATSREPLSVTGEVVRSVPPLAIPGEENVDPESILAFEATRLFVDRAQAVDPRFQPDAAAAREIARICRHLDGIPLAIELAAARVRALPVAELSRRLDDRFRLLRGGPRTALPHHQTLEATVAWSYDLLDEPERRLFERLSVFTGGFSLDAAERVGATDDGAVEDWDVLDILTRLIDRSLVVAEHGRTEARYRLLETLRVFARRQLEARGDGDDTREAHAAWAAEFVAAAAAEMSGDEELAWLDRLEAEFLNLRTALNWARQHGDEDTAAQIGDPLYPLLEP